MDRRAYIRVPRFVCPSPPAGTRGPPRALGPCADAAGNAGRTCVLQSPLPGLPGAPPEAGLRGRVVVLGHRLAGACGRSPGIRLEFCPLADELQLPEKFTTRVSGGEMLTPSRYARTWTGQRETVPWVLCLLSSSISGPKGGCCSEPSDTGKCGPARWSTARPGGGGLWPGRAWGPVAAALLGSAVRGSSPVCFPPPCLWALLSAGWLIDHLSNSVFTP